MLPSDSLYSILSSDIILSLDTPGVLLTSPKNSTRFRRNPSSLVFVGLNVGLILLLLLITIIKMSTFQCVSIHLIPSCSKGYCVYAVNYTQDDIEKNFNDLIKLHAQALIVNESEFTTESSKKLIRTLNKYGIVQLFLIDFSSEVKPFDIPNNGYIIQGTNFTIIKGYNWTLIKKHKKTQDAQSCVKTCLFIQILDSTDLTSARNEDFANKNGLCGYFYSHTIVPTLNSTYNETLVSSNDVIHIHTTLQSNMSRNFMPLNCSLAFEYPVIKDWIDNYFALSEAYKMRMKILSHYNKSLTFSNKTVNSTNIFVKAIYDPVRNIDYNIAVIPAPPSEHKFKDIETNSTSWSYLLGPSSLNGTKFDSKDTSEKIATIYEKGILVVALYP